MKNSDMMWYTVENIVILVAICFLVWLTGSTRFSNEHDIRKEN
jgi:hypothetical protein